MIITDKKKAVSGILSKMAKDGGMHEASVASESGEHDEYTSLAEDLIAGVQSGSVHALASCLKAFHEMIREEDEEQDAGE